MAEDLFSPIISVFKNNNGRYNLLDSAILEMFEFIVNESQILLMDHLITNFGPFLESIDYVKTFVIMKGKKEAMFGQLEGFDDQDEIQMDGEDCEFEPQLKKKKMK